MNLFDQFDNELIYREIIGKVKALNSILLLDSIVIVNPIVFTQL